MLHDFQRGKSAVKTYYIAEAFAGICLAEIVQMQFTTFLELKA